MVWGQFYQSFIPKQGHCVASPTWCHFHMTSWCHAHLAHSAPTPRESLLYWCIILTWQPYKGLGPPKKKPMSLWSFKDNPEEGHLEEKSEELKEYRCCTTLVFSVRLCCLWNRLSSVVIGLTMNTHTHALPSCPFALSSYGICHCQVNETRPDPKLIVTTLASHNRQ